MWYEYECAAHNFFQAHIFAKEYIKPRLLIHTYISVSNVNVGGFLVSRNLPISLIILYSKVEFWRKSKVYPKVVMSCASTDRRSVFLT